MFRTTVPCKYLLRRNRSGEEPVANRRFEMFDDDRRARREPNRAGVDGDGRGRGGPRRTRYSQCASAVVVAGASLHPCTKGIPRRHSPIWAAHTCAPLARERTLLRCNSLYKPERSTRLRAAASRSYRTRYRRAYDPRRLTAGARAKPSKPRSIEPTTSRCSLPLRTPSSRHFSQGR